MNRGSGLSREQIGTSNLGLSCLRDSHQRGSGVPRMPSPLFDSSARALLRACLPHTSPPEPVKPVCLSPAILTGRGFKSCSNTPPGKLTPRRFLSLFRAHAKPQAFEDLAILWPSCKPLGFVSSRLAKQTSLY